MAIVKIMDFSIDISDNVAANYENIPASLKEGDPGGGDAGILAIFEQSWQSFNL
jgi:hypothetical protein